MEEDAAPAAGFREPGHRLTLRSGCMCNDALSGGAAAGFAWQQAFSGGFPRSLHLGPGHRAGRQGTGDKCVRQRRTAGPDRNRRAWNAERLLLKKDRACGVLRPLDNSGSLNQSVTGTRTGEGRRVP